MLLQLVRRKQCVTLIGRIAVASIVLCAIYSTYLRLRLHDAIPSEGLRHKQTEYDATDANHFGIKHPPLLQNGLKYDRVQNNTKPDERSTLQGVMQMRWERFHRNAKLEEPYTEPGKRIPSVNLTEKEKRRGEQVLEEEGYNYVLGNRVPLDRTLGDLRPWQCRDISYPKELPTASVIILVHNEYWTSLLRTVHSIVNRSPPDHLKEVVLVDDGSTLAELGLPLEFYISLAWPDGIVRIVRNMKREGIPRARIRGADAATGDVIIFIDAQCEVTQGWLEPLLARIKENRKVVLVPEIDTISSDTLVYNGGLKTDRPKVGTFKWNLGFAWTPMQKKDKQSRKSEVDPLRSVTLVGCAFAVERSFFYEIGTFDDKMEGWGGEDVEFSFRVGMCGGSVEIIPCSRVGHTYKKKHQYTNDEDWFKTNILRTALTWLDEYIDVFYMMNSDFQRLKTDVTERVELRKKLGCKSFKWFLENVAPEKFVPNRNVYGWGKIHTAAGNFCLTATSAGKPPELARAIATRRHSSKLFSYTKDDQIRNDDDCLELRPNGRIVLNICTEQKPGVPSQQSWHYDPQSKRIMHLLKKLCLESQDKQLIVGECNRSWTQQWVIEMMLEQPPPGPSSQARVLKRVPKVPKGLT